MTELYYEKLINKKTNKNLQIIKSKISVIIKLIEEGINVLEISKLTGFSIDTCMHCREQLNIRKRNPEGIRINSIKRSSLLYRLLQLISLILCFKQNY